MAMAHSTMKLLQAAVLALTLAAGAAACHAAGGGGRGPAAGEATAGERIAAGLVAAARKQTWVPAIYNPAYAKIPYPMGDVSWYIGVCTDVVVRAYRALGVDLQQLVHKSGAGTGDTNIDHRRVEVLRKFLARAGQSLTPSRNPEAYQPGDLVTYHLPDGTFSKSHIVVVSDKRNAAGVPLVIHNRGWGVAEEDWLFAASITGHYRFRPVAAAVASH